MGAAIYPLPVELATAMTGPVGTAAIVKARLAGARFRRLAVISERGGRYVATINFREPVGPEKQDGLVVMLTVPPGVQT